MSALITVILPVFLVLGFGYLARWKLGFTDAAVDGLMKFAQSFGIPVLLFRALSTLELGEYFTAPLMISFYSGALAGFALAPFAPSSIALVPLAFGLVIGVLAALLPLERIAAALPILAGLMGLAVVTAALEGHGFAEIGLLIRTGIFFAANMTLAVAAGVIRWVSERWPGEVTRIGGRIAASWVAAILVL